MYVPHTLENCDDTLLLIYSFKSAQKKRIGRGDNAILAGLPWNVTVRTYMAELQ